MSWRGAVVALALACAACGDDTPYDAVCGDVRAEPGFDVDLPFCDRLSTYGFFTELGAQTLAAGVVPFEINTPLFSDHASKARFLWLPPGTAMQWSDDGAFELPVGAVLGKTFSFPRDPNAPSAGSRPVETRLLARRSRGWEGVAYLYDGAEAKRVAEGASVKIAWRGAGGGVETIGYLVPNKNQCKNCHEETEGTMAPLGPKARHLNRPGPAGSGVESQLAELRDRGALLGAPPAERWPRAAAADDPSSGTLEERARAYLDISCAHCHNPRGAARTSGLDLSITASPAALGVCKSPVATGRGSAGRLYDIVPGRPDESILMARIESNEADIKMPELGRTVIDEGGVRLLREWIGAMSGECAPPAPSLAP